MSKLIALLFLAVLSTPQPTPSVEAGATVYEAKIGKNLACNGHKYNTDDEWVAVPTEWILGGIVNCGDRVYTCLPNGY
jgi:hypothetical protein